MTVTSLQKEKQHLMRLTLDDGTECLLDTDVCAQHALRPGTVLDSNQLEALREESEYTRAKSRAMWYLDRSDYTERALCRKLRRAGFGERACAAVLARLTELGLVDDRRFAERYAERCADANVSRREMIRKMTEKGVPYEMAAEAADALDQDEEAQIRALLERKYARRLEAENGTEKVYAALIRKGFSFSAVRSVLKQYSEELEYSEEG